MKVTTTTMSEAYGHFIATLHEALQQTWLEDGPDEAYAFLSSLTPEQIKALVMVNIGASLT